MKLVACHIAGSRNVGDAVCSPAYYFQFGFPVEIVKFGDAIPHCAAVIFGGGAIGNNIGKVPAPARIKIAWGLGETRHGKSNAEPAPEGFDLYGSRDYGQPGAEWVPCASCMSPLFDDLREPQHEAVFYFNRRRTKPAVVGIPAKDNEVGFREAVEFLASGSVVVTNSYHGAYWSTLLGRGVIVVDAYSSKFRQFRHSPSYADDWRSVENVARYPAALTEARAANRAFFQRVMDRIA